MRRAARISSIASIGLVLAGSLVAASVARSQQPAPTTTADYPSLDSSISSMVQRGLTAKAMRAAAAAGADDPSTIALLLRQTRLRETFDYADIILGGLRRLAGGNGDQVEYAAGIAAGYSGELIGDDAGRRGELERLVAAIVARLPELPREQAARTARQLIQIENRLAGRRSSAARPMVRAFIEEYAGTEEARLAEVEVIRDIRDVDEEIAALDDFAQRYPGTVAGAAALHAKARAISNDRRGRRAVPPQNDPTPRFVRVLAVVEELESGRWPASAPVDTAAQLVVDFYVGDRNEFAAGNLEWLYRTLLDFVVDHARVLDAMPTGRDLDGAIYQIGKLGERLGDRMGAIEGAYDALEAVVADADELRHRKARFYVEEARDQEAGAAHRRSAVDKAFATLAALSRSSNENQARKASATTAALHFDQGSYEAAIEAYRSFLARWPASDWAWVATLRIGGAHEALGDREGAAALYRDAARRFVAPAPAAVLANVLAAKVNERLGGFDAALDHYVAAASAWDDDFGPRYVMPPHAAILHAELTDRIADLVGASRFPEGALLEGGRRLIEDGQWLDAQGLLRGLITAYPASPLVDEARYLFHWARLEQAFDIADVASAGNDEAAAAELLQTLADERWSPAAGAAGLAIAALTGKAGYDDRARLLTRDALRAWQRNQVDYYARRTGEATADGELAADVAAIRDTLFLPLGGEVYEHEQARWNAFDWPEAMPEYLIVDPDLRVKLGSGRTVRVRVSEPLPGLDNVLFMTSEHLGFLYDVLGRLGGTATRPPRAVMETPNQPIGASVEILALWKEFFPARPGHWGGWVLTSYPEISQIEFSDDGRTRARVAVTIGYSGCTVHLAKENGRWVVSRLSGFWIT